jgi:hypothetical protein
MYEWTDDWVGDILDTMDDDDEMLILSDHGIVTPWSEEDDAEYGEHSWRAFSSSTTGDRPRDIYDVKQWVEEGFPRDEDGSMPQEYANRGDDSWTEVEFDEAYDLVAKTFAELAEHSTVARATFEEHLRKAENKLLVNVGQFVRLMLGSQPEDSLGIDAQPTAEMARSD